MNIFVANTHVWRKHRRIMGPAFTNILCVPALMFNPYISQRSNKIRGSLGRNIEDLSRNGRRRRVEYTRTNQYPRGASFDFQGELLLGRIQAGCLKII